MANLKFFKNMLALLLLLLLVSCTGNGGEMKEQVGVKVIDNLFLMSDSDGAPNFGISGPLEVQNLLIVDINQGMGISEVSLTDTLEVNYLGVGANSGFVFDSSYSRNETAQFPLAAVIKGWQDGLIGMKEGGRRVLIIPADQAYGASPPPGSGIEPNEALIFVVDLIKIL